ncbi:UPF0149 family protein [Kangiella sediminilitoris]|uniref:YecA family protein n=1 Tax=Kangiella sediminilitoris TaxID=1144748 RepID=A0A1B3B7W6_9GAMM|nr:UPF0149 family protein [Kangiella sediminilitoris]AOE48881.1 hypothetical protein KS2013_152 [Kangiella sediminilitoris]
MNYTQVSELCENFFPDLSPSELAGMIHGLFGHGFVVESGRWQQQMSEFLASGDMLPEPALQGLEQLMAFTQKDYQPDSFSIDLIRPEDDYPLAQRAKAIGEWCQGYLVGYGLVPEKNGQKLEGEAKEALQDISEIAQIDFEMDEPDEEMEKAFMTVCEHIKMSALLLCQANQPEANVEADKQNIH